MMPERVRVTDAAAALLHQLRQQYGELILHLSGGCCEGSAPMCLRRSGFRIAARDILLGVVEDCPFYVSAAQFPYWAHSQITLDVTTDGGGDSFSIEAVDGVRFLVRSRLFSDLECDELDAAGPPSVGPDAAERYVAEGQAASRTA
jgi:uncharacterized protein (DUF779 family)